MTLHKKNHITRTLLAVSMLAMSGGALAAQVPPGTQLAEKQELVRNNGSEPASLDPHKVESDVEFNIISDLFEGLVNVSPAGVIQPRLAERWENKDNLLWTFHLRPGLTWSDGTAITAQDIVWSWQRLVSPATASPYASYPGNMHIANAREIALGQKGPETLGVKALNDTTLQVTLTQPNAAFLAMLAHPSLVPIDKVLVERYADKWTRPEHIVTSGPYKLSQWVVNERLVAERNAKYWDNAHTVINKVTYLPISSEAADVNRYKAGEIDIVYTVPINQFAQLQKTMGDQLDVSPQLATYYYEFNTTRPPFNDARVRRALNMALDKDIIAGKVLGQGQRPAWLIGQPDIGGVTLHNPDYASWPREKRIAEAKNCWRRRGMMKAIRWSLPCSITPLSRTSVSPLPPALCGRKTSASRRSYRTRSGRRCWIPCIRITSTPSATRGLPTTTMPPPSSILSVPGIARTPVSTATRLTTRRCATRRKPPTWRPGANTISRRKICWRRMFPPFRSITMYVPIW